MNTKDNKNSNKFPSSGGVAVGRGGLNADVGDGDSVSATVSEPPHASRTPPEEGNYSSVKRDTRNYLELPYNPKLKQKARELRKAGNLSEVLLWQQLKKKQLLGLDFDRQKIIGNYIVDFYNANCNVIIEIDGESHQNKYEYDKKRENFLTGLGLKVIHFDDLDVKQNSQGVIDYLEKEFLTILKNPFRKEQFPSHGGVAAGRGGANADVGNGDSVSTTVSEPPHASRTLPKEGN